MRMQRHMNIRNAVRKSEEIGEIENTILFKYDATCDQSIYIKPFYNRLNSASSSR